MSYSRLCDFANGVAEDVCKNKNAVSMINAVVPEAVGLAASHASGGNPAVKAAAKAATRAAVRKAPNGVAHVAVALTAGVAMDLASIAALPLLAGYLIFKGAEKIFDTLDDL